MNRKSKKLLLLSPLILLVLLLFIALGGEIVRQLWNWLLPALFGWPRITFWQALGILALCRILFGGVGVLGARGARPRRHTNGPANPMTSEERDRFRRGIHVRFGLGGDADDSAGA